MSSAGSISVTSNFTDSPGGASQVPSFTTNITGGINAVTSVILGATNTTITIPAGATEMIILFPASSPSTNKILKGVAGDTGLTLQPAGQNGPLAVPSGSGATTFVLTVTGTVDTLPTSIYFR